MAVPEQIPYIEYIANGTTVTFPLGYDCIDSDFLIVSKNGIEVGSETWVLNNNSVVFNEPPSIDTKITIERNTAIERTTDFNTYNNSFRPQPVNADFDHIVHILQEIAARLLREISDRKLSDTELKQFVQDYVESVLSINNPEAITLVLADIVQTSIDGEIQTQQEFNEYILSYVNIKYPSIAEFIEQSQAAFDQFETSTLESINASLTVSQEQINTAIAAIQPTVDTAVANAGNMIGAADLTALQLITDKSNGQNAMLDNGDIYRFSKPTSAAGTWVFTGLNYTYQAKVYVDSVPKNEQSAIAAEAGLLANRYVSAQGFKAAFDFLMQKHANELSKLNENLAKLQLQLSNVESIANAASLKLDSYRAGIVKADYYLSADGSDTNAGTISAPFRSFAPILAMSAGSLNNKIIALKCGSSFAAMDISFLNANNCLITSYGNSADGRPFIDCTTSITETWSEHATGVWKVTLTHNADTKIYPNFFKNGIPVQKVISLSALTSASDKAVYAENQTSSTFTAYMKSSVNPAIDGNSYRWSKYGSAITLIGTDSTIDNIYALGNAHQDGALVVKTNDASGGCKLSRCRVDWGNRHSALVGSGARQSVAEFNEFYGGADDVETGNILNAGGGANALVFNSADHQSATCVDRYNVYDGLTRPNYNAPASLTYFTGGYGHDAVEGRPMLRYTAYGNTFKNIENVHSCCAVSGTFDDCAFDNVTQLFSADDVNTNYTLSNSKGNVEQLVRGTNLNITLLWKDNEIIVNDLARGTAGFVRYAEGTGSINLTYDGGTLDVRGVRSSTAAANRVLNRVKNGSLKINNLTVLPVLATPFTYFTDVISGGTFTLDATSGNNKYSIGTVFRRNGTEYNLAGWIGAGYEQSTSKRHDMPIATLQDNFSRTDKLLVDDVYVNVGGVTSSLALRSNKLATLNSSTQAVKLGSVESQNLWCRKITQSTVGSSGIALLVENETNFIIVRETSTQYQLQVCNNGSFTTNNGSGVTPAVGQEVIAVIKDVIDPSTKVQSKMSWLIADNRNVINSQLITMPSAMSNTKSVGFVGRGAANPLLSDVSWGLA